MAPLAFSDSTPHHVDHLSGLAASSSPSLPVFFVGITHIGNGTSTKQWNKIVRKKGLELRKEGSTTKNVKRKNTENAIEYKDEKVHKTVDDAVISTPRSAKAVNQPRRVH